jgi:hypothetical protein
MQQQNKNQNKFATITAIYRGERYKSIPLELVENSDNIRLVITLSEQGTSASNMLKFPISQTSFMIFSREQLNETLFEVEIFDGEKITTKTKKKETLKN